MLELANGEEAILGYGSLLCKGSMEKTLGRPYDGPFRACRVAGWRRSWNVFLPNRGEFVDERGVAPAKIVYLNVRRDAASAVNGVLFVVPAGALAGFDQREWVYDRVDISRELECLEFRGRAWMYVARPEYLVHGGQFPDYAVRQSYIDIVEQGLTELGAGFRAEYEASTDAVPREWVIRDRRAV
ncbi:MAG TPA: gamma-glutamylcyclotransferase family protein [Verrucomicrobiae bacterium]|nr:gamma-glutamylcyclotransferase family protein [Verrucomicrobiae bacterium]